MTETSPVFQIIYVLTVLLAVFFMVEKYALPSVMLLGIFFVVLVVKSRGRISVPSGVFIIAMFGVLVLVQFLFEPSEYFSRGAATRDLTRYAAYALTVLVVANAPVKQRVFLGVWKSVFFAVFLITLIQFLGIQGINVLLEQIYGETRHLMRVQRQVQSGDLVFGQFRTGSVFLNSNSLAKFLLIYLAVFLWSAVSRVYKDRRYVYIIPSIIAATLILTGSRTGYVISVLLVIYTIVSKMHKKISLLTAIQAAFLFAVAVMLLAFVAYAGYDTTSIRAVDLGSGIETSLTYKYGAFIQVLREFGSANVLVGLGRFDTDIPGFTFIDFDIGYLVGFFGVLGIILYVLMLVDFGSHRNAVYHNSRLLKQLLIIVFVFFGFTGGVFLNFRVFSMFATVLYVNLIKETESPSDSYTKDTSILAGRS